MANPFFSIVVPVYKVEAYLDQCVQSVLAQSFNDYELILVDDGSPDRCGEMCDAYAEKDERIKVIHKKNGGLSSARNAGLEIIKGKYTIFLDSDDFWDRKSVLKKINSLIRESNANVLLFPLKRYYEDNGESSLTVKENIDRNIIQGKSKNMAIAYMIRNNVYRACACNKVIFSEIIKNNNMRFKEGMLSEDMDWCGDLLLFARNFDYCNIPFYCYRQEREGSITKGINPKLIADKIIMCRNGWEQSERIKDKELQYLFRSYYAYEYSVLLGVSYGYNDRVIIEEMRSLSKLLDYSACKKVKAVSLLKKMTGFNCTRKILGKFVSRKR